MHDQNDASIPNIGSFVQSWTKQNGHPVVHVHVLNSTAIRITQEYFLFDPKVIDSEVKEKLVPSFTLF